MSEFDSQDISHEEYQENFAAFVGKMFHLVRFLFKSRMSVNIQIVE